MAKRAISFRAATSSPIAFLGGQGVLAVLFLGVAVLYGYYFIFSRSMSMDEGYLMITVQGFLDGHPLYDSVFTQYGPFYYLYEWTVRVLVGIPLTHDATRLLCLVHWMGAAVLLGVAGGVLTRSLLGGVFVFTQAVIHLSSLAAEPGHPQEVVALLMAVVMAISLSERAPGRRREWLAVMAAALVCTKINVGVFFGIALFLALRCQAMDRWTRGPWFVGLGIVCAALPFVLMRQHLTSAWCRSFALLAAMTVVINLIVVRCFTRRAALDFRDYLRTILYFLVPFGLVLGATLMWGTSTGGLLEGLFLTPLRMPGVVVLPIPISAYALLNAAVSLSCALGLLGRPSDSRAGRWILLFKLLFGLAGAFVFVGQAQAQFIWLVPWIWLAAVPANLESEDAGRKISFARGFLCLTIGWQMLQAYPVAGSQVNNATMLMVLIYAVCLRDVWDGFTKKAWVEAWRERCTLRAREIAVALAAAILLLVFANGWCRLPAVRQHYASLSSLGFPGSDRVRVDAETLAMYRGLQTVLEKECDTFVIYPGLNSFYFWTGKRPPTQLNSTGWGQLSWAQQDQILNSLLRSERPMLVIIADAMRNWTSAPPPQIKPLIDHVIGDWRPWRRVGPFVIYLPKETLTYSTTQMVNPSHLRNK